MVATQAKKRVLILAGPNGAGKTTFAREFLPDEAQCPTGAGRLMVQLINEHVTRGDSFAFETTLADKSYAHHIPDWQASRYHVTLVFLALPSGEVAIQRVLERVAQGGHFVPEGVVRRRFRAGKANFETVYNPLVNAWALYDNSGSEPLLLDWDDKR